jgi:hypothetical protein
LRLAPIYTAEEEKVFVCFCQKEGEERKKKKNKQEKDSVLLEFLSPTSSVRKQVVAGVKLRQVL